MLKENNEHYRRHHPRPAPGAVLVQHLYRAVEEGQQSKITHLWGPYATREEAEKAMETAQKRNEEWDNQD